MILKVQTFALENYITIQINTRVICTVVSVEKSFCSQNINFPVTILLTITIPQYDT